MALEIAGGGDAVEPVGGLLFGFGFGAFGGGFFWPGIPAFGGRLSGVKAVPGSALAQAVDSLALRPASDNAGLGGAGGAGH